MDQTRQCVAAVEVLAALGCDWRGEAWQPPLMDEIVPASDHTHAMLVKRADALAACAEVSDAEQELEELKEGILSNDEARWPEGVMGGSAREGLRWSQ